MSELPAASIDMILCDLPYGVLNKSNPAAKWDCVIPFADLWKQYERIIKERAAIVLFGSGMFTADLMESNRKLWRYNLVWDKIQKTGFLNARRMPLRQHEDICVFYKKLPPYNPQMVKGELRKKEHTSNSDNNTEKNQLYGDFSRGANSGELTDERFPASIISISKGLSRNNDYHPTQKPVELLEWLIKTYTNEGGVILDNCCGSGSTGVAAMNTGRKFIGMEIEEKYYEIAMERLGLEEELHDELD